MGAVGYIHISAVFFDRRRRAAGENVHTAPSVHCNVVRRAASVDTQAAARIQDGFVSNAAIGDVHSTVIVYCGLVCDACGTDGQISAAHRSFVCCAAGVNQRRTTTSQGQAFDSITFAYCGTLETAGVNVNRGIALQVDHQRSGVGTDNTAAPPGIECDCSRAAAGNIQITGVRHCDFVCRAVDTQKSGTAYSNLARHAAIENIHAAATVQRDLVCRAARVDAQMTGTIYGGLIRHAAGVDEQKA